MKKASVSKTKKSASEVEFRPYRVLFLVVVIAVTCLLMFAVLGVTY